MVISLEATKINPIFAPVIRQVKSGCGRFFVYRNPVPFLKLKFGEYLAVQPINIVYKNGRKRLCVLSSAVWRIESGA